MVIELIRASRAPPAILALALIFYGGIAGGVLLTSLASGRATALNQYLFGSLSTVATSDLVWLGVVALLVLAILAVFGREIFVMALDPDIARTQGIRTTAMSMLLTVLAAMTVVIGMRTVGLLLVSAIMIVPIAAAQQLTRGFRTTAVVGVVVGELSAVLGLVASFYLDVPPGPAIVFLALGLFAVCAAIAVPLRRRRARRSVASRAGRPCDRERTDAMVHPRPTAPCRDCAPRSSGSRSPESSTTSRRS